MSERLIFCPDCGETYGFSLEACPNCGSHRRVGHLEAIIRKQWEEEANTEKAVQKRHA